jgi:hypothetical protein
MGRYAVLIGLATLLPISLNVASTPEQLIPLHVGQSKMAHDLKLELMEVLDNRCPEDINCIWAGELIAKLKITGAKQEQIMLTNFDGPPSQHKRSYSMEGYKVILAGIAPKPLSNIKINQSDYEITFSVTNQSQQLQKDSEDWLRENRINKYWVEQAKQPSDIPILAVSDGCATWSYYSSKKNLTNDQASLLRNAIIYIVKKDAPALEYTDPMKKVSPLIDVKSTDSILQNSEFIKWAGRDIINKMRNDKIITPYSKNATPTQTEALNKLSKKYNIYLIFPVQDTGDCY